MKIANPEIFRVNVTKKLNNVIKRKKLSLNLEKGIFNYAIQTAKLRNIVRKWDNEAFAMIYIDKFKSILLNLNGKSTIQNKDLLKRLKKKEFKAHELAFMTHHELYPEKWKALIEEKIKRDKKRGCGGFISCNG